MASHVEYLYRVAYRFCGNNQADAEDLVQDLLIKLYPRVEEIRALEHLRPWLVRVMYRQFIDQVRRNKRSPLYGADDVMKLEIAADEGQTAASLLEQERLQHQLLTAMNALNEEQRAVVSLHDIEGYTLQELEDMLETPIGTLKSRLHRARAKLRGVLEPFAGPERDTDSEEEKWTASN